MDNLVYHEATPANNNSNGFEEFNTISWNLMAEGRKLVPNSIRVDFDIQVLDATGGNLVRTKRIAVDNVIGGHAFWESWQTSVESVGLIANEQEYTRWAKTFFSATQDINDNNSAIANAEGRTLHPASGEPVLEQVASRQDSADSQNANYLKNASFSIKPLIALNRYMGDSYSFNKNGSLRISANLSRNGHALYGSDNASGNYKLFNVRMRFTTVPDDGKQGKMLMNSYNAVKASINSSQFSIDSKIPSKMCNGVVINFLDQGRENEPKQNTQNLEQYPNLDSIKYSFNNSLNKYISYDITDRGDMVRKGLEALTEGNLNSVHCKNIYNNRGYLVGLPFQEYVDLSTNKFTTELQSSALTLTTEPKLIYLYFLTLISL